MLVGRDAETATLDRLLEAARDGRSGALLLRGEAGIGKTALLDHAAAIAEGFLVLRATGIESEAELPYATLHQLLRPPADRIDGLAEPQARALRGALGLADERDVDRFLVGVGTLTVLADAADEQPVLALLDDAAWFDRASCDALAFAARRLQAEGVVLLFAVRDELGVSFALPGVDELQVGRLGDADARRVLAAGVDATRRDEVLARAAGNPLALLELARPRRTERRGRGAGLRGSHRRAAGGHAEAAAAGGRGQHAVARGPRRRRASSRSTRQRSSRRSSAGLVLVADAAIEFRHPLVRSAAYRAAPFARRARAHLALAAALEGEENADRRAWHRAAAVLGTDEQAADDLERTADRALLRGGHSAASVGPGAGRGAHRRCGLEVAAAGGRCGRRRLAGDTDRALALVERVESRRRRHTRDHRLRPRLVAGQRGSSMACRVVPARRAHRSAGPRAPGRHARRDGGLGVRRTERSAELRAAAAAIPRRPRTSGRRRRSSRGSMAFVEQDYDQAMPAFARAGRRGPARRTRARC